MRIRWFGSISVALVLTIALVLTGCGGGGGGKQITVASNIAYRPFEFEKKGKPVGFDIDLMREIGKRADFTPKFQNVTFDGIIPALANNDLFDVGASAITITETREKKVDFSDPYFDADQSLMVRSGSPIKSEDDIGDGIVGVQRGTTGERKAREFKQQGKITRDLRTFNTIEEAFSALENRQIDAVINDLPVSDYREETGGGSLEVVQTIQTDEKYGIAFPKDSDLLEPTNKALEEIMNDGTYSRIHEKWFGEKPKEIP